MASTGSFDNIVDHMEAKALVLARWYMGFQMVYGVSDGIWSFREANPSIKMRVPKSICDRPVQTDAENAGHYQTGSYTM